MRFRNLILFFLISLFFSCDDVSESVTTIGEIPLAIETLTGIVNSITYTGTLEDGQNINFDPANIYSSVEDLNYTSLFETKYVNELSLNTSFLKRSTASYFKWTDDNSDSLNHSFFQYTYQMTFGELELMFPDLVEVNFAFENWIFAVGIGSRDYNELDVLNNRLFGVTDFGYLIIDPNLHEIKEGSFTRRGAKTFKLEGRYSFFDSIIKSSGTFDSMHNLISFNNFPVNHELEGEYEMVLREVNLRGI